MSLNKPDISAGSLGNFTKYSPCDKSPKSSKVDQQIKHVRPTIYFQLHINGTGNNEGEILAALLSVKAIGPFQGR